MHWNRGQAVTDKPSIEAKRRQVDAVGVGCLGQACCLLQHSPICAPRQLSIPSRPSIK